uniref:nucleoside diphosphate kinase regulator n=1 Tax=Pararhizobium sp. IMCC3301 TaxID=3067904 RepID=UPI0027411F9C|nr:nucleoside diphosphate kinase regulator [Pararhizobium sp. IMCC3301]
MTTPMTNTMKHRRERAPKIVINADDLAHIEALAESALQRNPALANRLLDEIGRARIVKSARMPKNVVSIGSVVTYRDETTGQQKTVTLVYPEDADIAHQRVSVMTPIGVALLGLAEGAAFYWDTRFNQRRVLTVIGVEQPSTAEDARI